MEFNKIKLITITCPEPDCKTEININYSGEHSNDKKFETFLCPCCGHNLHDDISSAVHNAYEYNEVCEKISKLQKANFIEFNN